ncbi:hypothetical protein MNV49_003731 [Pseudohyphozyma bogoriensis]|nr:hypothetical protein MNV49_003731 [Pseudohyphozyma bogoriensis]
MPGSLNNSEKEMKGDESQIENSGLPSERRHVQHTAEELKHADKALALAENRVEVSDEDSRRICRKIDTHVLPLLGWIYFLQILDKTIIGYAAIFGLKTNAHLVGDEYSTVGAIGYYAQLGAQPLAAFLLVKYPVRYTMPVIVTCWGASLCGMAGSTNYAGLLGSRFLLGWFEAAALPLFSVITIAWYRRAEQPWRGLANVIGAPLVYGLGQVRHAALYSYQIIFLVTGLITVVSGIAIYFWIDSSVVEARFLTPEDRAKGVERLRANNQGVVSNEFKWGQVGELMLEPKTWLFIAMSFFVNVGASVSTVFGPLLLQGLVGLDAETSVLLNMPFGTLQIILIFLFTWLATRFKTKSVMLAAATLPIIMGLAILYAVPRTDSNEGPLLFGYYMLPFLFATNPLIVSWMAANTSGQSKKTAAMCAFNAASAAGNILGPYLFKAEYAPDYIPSLKAVMGIFCGLFATVLIQVANLRYLNKRKEAQRVQHGKPAKLADYSMNQKFEVGAADDNLGENAFLDMTDKENDEFQPIRYQVLDPVGM